MSQAREHYCAMNIIRDQETIPTLGGVNLYGTHQPFSSDGFHNFGIQLLEAFKEDLSNSCRVFGHLLILQNLVKQ